MIDKLINQLNVMIDLSIKQYDWLKDWLIIDWFIDCLIDCSLKYWFNWLLIINWTVWFIDLLIFDWDIDCFIIDWSSNGLPC